MLSVAEAQKVVLDAVRPLDAERRELSPAVLGQVLAEAVASDLDSPPFDKAMMDGYAVRSCDFAGNVAEMTVVEEIAAGRMPTRTLGPGEAARIMTGAPIPPASDAVVMLERSTPLDERRVRLEEPKIAAGLNILRRGREMRAGEIVLRAGTRVRPAELGILASVGRTHALLIPRPTVAVIATGDEIVPADETPGPGRIRNSNAPMLSAQAERAGARTRWIGIAPDETAGLRRLIEDGLNDSVLVLSGGVSAGKRDLVPVVLESLGFRAAVRHVAMKPGKPMLFGVVPREGRPPALVFGLPGNPVSSMVCFELFVRPALRRMMGRDDGTTPAIGKLAEGTTYRADRPTYHPATVRMAGSSLEVRLLPWIGSADLRGVAQGNGFAAFPAGECRFDAGAEIPVLLPEAD